MVDSQPIRSKDPSNGDPVHKQRAKTTPGRRPSSGSTPAGGTAGGTTSTNGAAKKVSHVPCKFFRQGVCQAGDSCPFSHDTEAVSQAVCKYFQKGNCKFGAKCALAHITPDGRRVNTKKDKPLGSRSQQQHHQLSSSSAPTPSGDGAKGHGIDGQSKTPIKPATPVSLSSKSVSSTYSSAYLTASQGALASSGSPPSNSIDDNSLLADTVTQQSGFFASPLTGASSGGNTGVMSPLVASTSARSSFSFSRASAGSATARSSSFRSAVLTESQLFGSQRVGSMSRLSSSGISSSIWADRLKNPLAYEGSAIVDDDDDDHDGDDIEEGFEEDLVPPSLSDLLTPQERERRNSRHSSSHRPAIASPHNPSELWSSAKPHRSSSGQQTRVLEPIGTPDKNTLAAASQLTGSAQGPPVGLGVCGSGSKSPHGNDNDICRTMPSH